MDDSNIPANSRVRFWRSDLHREVVKLVALTVLAVAAFFVTRAVAANSREMSRRDAEEWYRRGEASVAAGRLDEAIQAFRRANVKSRGNQIYMVALARAEVLNGDADAARQILMTLRESAPDDASINLQLARLARD